MAKMRTAVAGSERRIRIGKPVAKPFRSVGWELTLLKHKPED